MIFKPGQARPRRRGWRRCHVKVSIGGLGSRPYCAALQRTAGLCTEYHRMKLFRQFKQGHGRSTYICRCSLRRRKRLCGAAMTYASRPKAPGSANDQGSSSGNRGVQKSRGNFCPSRVVLPHFTMHLSPTKRAAAPSVVSLIVFQAFFSHWNFL